MSEKGATIAGLKLANAFVLTTRGVPQLYYGDEIAMEGPDEPTTRGDFPGGFPGDKRNAFTAAGRTKEEQELFEYIRRLTTLRRELKPLRTGAFCQSLRFRTAIRLCANHIELRLSSSYSITTTKRLRSSLTSHASPREMADLTDQLGVSRPCSSCSINDGKLRVSLPKRSAAIFVRSGNPLAIGESPSKDHIMQKPRLSFWQIWNMSFGFLGFSLAGVCSSPT